MREERRALKMPRPRRETPPTLRGPTNSGQPRPCAGSEELARYRSRSPQVARGAAAVRVTGWVRGERLVAPPGAGLTHSLVHSLAHSFIELAKVAEAPSALSYLGASPPGPSHWRGTDGTSEAEMQCERDYWKARIRPQAFSASRAAEMWAAKDPGGYCAPAARPGSV